MTRHRPRAPSGDRSRAAPISAAATSSGDGAGAPPDTTEAAATITAAVVREVERQLAAELPPGLHLVATPIGNLSDVTVRAVAVLARADRVLCEDTRHSRTLLAHFGIRARTEPYHEHNADEMRPRVLAALGNGERIALVSDAGTPLVSDPGYKLVRDALAAGHRVESVPGPCAAIAALGAAGLPTDSFHFAGFLPPRSAARGRRITELAGIPATLVFYEAPQRVAETLADLAAILGPRPAVVARELTKLHEDYQRGTLPDLAIAAASREVKGEIVLLVGPPAEREASDADIAARLDLALETMSLRDASRRVAEDLSVPRSRVYDLGLAREKAVRGG